MDLWQRARGFAEEAAKRSQEISKEAAKRSQEFVSDTAKKSWEIAAEATKKADLIKVEALRRADQIKTLASEIPIPPIPPIAHGSVAPEPPAADLERFGVTDELREFVKGVTLSTFRDFPMEDELEMSEVSTVSNVRQDLNEWQARHATLVLSTVKEISKFRYELCPRYMKERKFWRIYFILVSSYVVPYEKQFMEELNAKPMDEKQDDGAKENSTSQDEVKETKLQSKTSNSTNAEHDLDAFLLGDLDDGGDASDDDFDKIESTSGLDSDDDDDTKRSK